MNLPRTPRIPRISPLASAWLARAGAGLALAVTCTAGQAFCGFYAGKADANLFNEASQVILVREGKRTVISMLNDYQGPLSEFALVVPTPTVLQKGQVRVAEKLSFERLDAYSSPRLAEYHDADPCRMNFHWGWEAPLPYTLRAAPAPAPAAAMKAADSETRRKELGVTVEAQYTLDEYDIVSLSATQSDGLETWLRENGYAIPKGASAALAPYIKQGMKFFVAKVNLAEHAKTGYTTLRPLQFAFESDKFMLPMRLGMLNAPPDKPQDLIVYVLSKEGRVESSNYRTARLPANMNLPYFVKPKFQDFYKALFANEASKEQHRVVFTEYFWDMAWCDPCAANPLSGEELRRAGVFWLGGDRGAERGGAQPVMLTRMHVRYTAKTFPEDLMFTQTKDRQNWQARYVIHNPFEGSPAQCSARLGEMDCDAMCKPRVAQLLSNPSAWPFGANLRELPQLYRDKDPLALQRDCVSACFASKQAGLQLATRYYQSELPQRLDAEKQTLARLTGWSLADIAALPGARTSLGGNGNANGNSIRAGSPTWWERLFEASKAKP